MRRSIKKIINIWSWLVMRIAWGFLHYDHPLKRPGGPYTLTEWCHGTTGLATALDFGVWVVVASNFLYILVLP